MSNFIVIAHDKDCIGTIVRVDTPDGKRLIRKSNEEFLDFEYLKEFIGCEIKQEMVDKNNPTVVDTEATQKADFKPKKLAAVEVDEELTKKMGRTLFCLTFEDLKPAEKSAEQPETEVSTEMPEEEQPASQQPLVKHPLLEQLKDKNTFEYPNREFLEQGDVILLLNAEIQQPIGYARIEYIRPSQTIGKKVVGILQLIPGRAQLFACEVPMVCLKVEDNKAFTVRTAPFPMQLVYFPFLKPTSILRPPSPGDGMLRHGGKVAMRTSPNQPPLGGLR